MKRFLVTGSASGIGAAVVATLVADGHEVIGLDRTARADAGTKTLGVDLGDPAAVAAALAELPDVDVLCNVAGVPGTHPDDAVLAVNFFGLRQLTEGLYDRLPDGGAIVNVASRAGAQWPTILPQLFEFLAQPDLDAGLEWWKANDVRMPAYAFGKAAVIVYTMQLAWRGLPRDIRANSVSPGAVETPVLPDFKATMGPVLDLIADAMGGRYGKPEQVAEAIKFLASDQAGWINGVDLYADGGCTAGMTIGGLDLAALAAASTSAGNPS